VLNYFSNIKWDKTTPELATFVQRIIKKITGNPDFYYQLKEKYDFASLGLYPKLADIVEASDDPL